MVSSTSHDACPARSAPIPRGEKRRSEIAAVAERIFFENGFTDTTMQTIAAEAGASKETLYRHFGSKEGLFSEIVEKRSNVFLEGLDEGLRHPGAVGEALARFAARMVDKMMQRDSLCLFRLVIAEGPRNSDLGRIFYEQGPERVQRRLAQYFATATDRGELTCADPVLAAKLFLGSIMTYHHIVALVVPDRPPLTAEQRQSLITEAVALFLARYQPAASDATSG